MEQLEGYPHHPVNAVATSNNSIHSTQLNYDPSKSYITLEPNLLLEPHVDDTIEKYYPVPCNLVQPHLDVNLHGDSHTFQSFFQSNLTKPVGDAEPTEVKPVESVTNVKKDKKRDHKKRKRKESNHTRSRKENKFNRNSNKTHFNYKGIEVKPREFINYDCFCEKKCSERLSAEDRKSEFEKFWALSSHENRIAFIAAKVTEHELKKKPSGKSDAKRRDFTRIYTLCSTAVCRNMFCKTLRISSGRIHTALTKIRMRATIKDQRGKKKSSITKLSSKKFLKTSANKTNITENKYETDISTTKDTFIDALRYQWNTNDMEISTVSSAQPTETGKNYSRLIDGTSNNLVFQSFKVEQSRSCDNFTNTNNEIETLPSTSIVNKETSNINRSKPGRKPKFDQNRQENKTNRNNNKTHFNHKGKIVEPKQFLDYNCDCSKKCYLAISLHDRLVEFEKFWTLSYNAQVAYIIASVSEKPVKMKNPSKNSNVKDFIRKYTMGSTQVCREMFCRTLNISPGRIHTALKKFRLKVDLSDQRGAKQGGHNKIPVEKRNRIISFLKRIPLYRSQYCKENRRSRFIAPDITHAKLYVIYKEEENDNAVSTHYFKNKFYTYFDFSNRERFHFDSSKICVTKDRNAESNSCLERFQDDHKALETEKCLEYDMLMAKKYTDLECLTFDIEKPYILPHINSNVMFFKRRLWLHNFGIYSCKKDQSYCYVWPEGIAGKGAQEVGSCLLKYAKEEIIWSPDINHLILWTHSSHGLTRNVKLTLMLNCLMQMCPSLKSIKLKFLSPSRNCLPNRKDFTDIEKKLKNNNNNIFTPEEYANLMRNSRKKNPPIVKTISNTEFLSTTELEKQFNTIVPESNNFNWAEIHEISMFVEDLHKVYFKRIDGEIFSINIRPNFDSHQVINFVNFLVPLWPLGKPITAAKFKDLNSVLHMIPDYAKGFYSNLQCGATDIEDDVDGLNEELDFEIEN